MPHTLCLYDELLARGRRLRQAGQPHLAAACCERLLALAGVPGLIAAQAHQIIGEIALKRRHYRRARRHLVAAVRLAPEGPRGHFLLGLSCSQDEAGDPRRAARHFRRALRLAPHLPRCRGELGLVLLRLGETDEGLAQLREAARQAPEDAAATGRLVRGLLRAGQFDEALVAVRAARFRAPRCERLHKLWVDLQLAALRRDRDAAAALAGPGEPVVLPFLRAYAEPPAGVTRHAAHVLKGPRLVRLRRQARDRRAP